MTRLPLLKGAFAMHREDITPNTIHLVEDLTSRFSAAYCRDDAWSDYDRMVSAVTSAGRSSAYNHRKLDLVKKLSACGIDCSMQTSQEDLRRMIARMPLREEMEAQLYDALFEMYTQFPSASDFMARLVHRLADPDFREDPVRVAIVKQFCRHSNHGTLAVKKLVLARLNRENPQSPVEDLDRESVIAHLTDEIFQILEQNMSADEWEKYELLQLADDLASGKFRTYGKTKRFLYLFAMAFHMQAFDGPDAPDYNPDTDVEKNLFRDYYNDNLLRYITDDYATNAAAYEREPSGEGINYKNYAEVIYLYYLNRPGMTPRQRITAAKGMIDKCTRRARKEHLLQSADESPREYSEYYRQQFLADVCSLKPDELENYICGNYVFPDTLDKLGPMMAESQHRSAALVYDRVLAKVLEHTDPETLSEMSYDLDLTIAMSRYDEDSPFAMLMTKLNEMLTIRWTDYPVSGSDSESRLTRTNLISLCVYQFRSAGLAKGLSLPQLLRSFRAMTDPLLEEARFQRISEKNVFDMFAVVALYHQENYNPPLD